MGHDLTKILKEHEDYDFGFSTTSEEELRDLSEVDKQEYERRLRELEKLIIPFLKKLLDTADQDIIRWPNRAPIIKQQIEKVLKLTRG